MENFPLVNCWGNSPETIIILRKLNEAAIEAENAGISPASEEWIEKIKTRFYEVIREFENRRH